MTVRLAAICLMAAGGLWMSGCSASAPSTQPSNPADRALADPMGYSPNADTPDISGGSLGEYRPQSMNKDVDHVLNP